MTRIIPYPFTLFIAFLLLVTMFSPDASAQSNAMNTPGEILQAMKKLKVTGSVLYIAAHPDDENTRLLSYLANERKLRTGYLSLTRGDGGQNLIGTEQGDALGLLRTQELLAARRIDGAEQFFTRANDFGYSKNPEETFHIWNRKEVLADVVWTIRKFRPDIIITRFPTTGEGGHGHHTASAILASEAFEAAADPTKFPEQLKYVSVWKTQRLFWNTFNFGSTNTTSEDQVKIDVGGFNVLLGKSYGEIAAESRSSHKSQGFGSAKSRGSQLEYFKLIKGDSVRDDIFEHIAQDWTKYPGTAQFNAEIDKIISDFKPAEPSLSIPGLTKLYSLLESLNIKDAGLQYYKKLKMEELKNILLASAGIWLEATAENSFGVPDNTMQVKVQAITRNIAQVKLEVIHFPEGKDSILNFQFKQNQFYSFNHSMTLAATQVYSDPYWLRSPHPVGTYIVRDQQKIGLPENADGLSVVFKMNIAGLDLAILRPLVYKSTDPVKGEIYRPFEVLPPVTIEMADKVLVFSDAQPRKVSITITANAPIKKGKLILAAPEGWSVHLDNAELNFSAIGEEIKMEATITSSANSKNGKLLASVIVDGKNYNQSIRRISYDHVPYQFFLNDAAAKLVRIELKKTGNRIAYIPGAGDEVPASLRQIGYEVTMLTDAMLATEDLSSYDAIVAGIRAYNINDHLPQQHTRLMKYVEDGGNYIVQYNTNSRVGPLNASIGPWPFTITKDRVTDEKAVVNFINPSATVLNQPNKITNADFADWVQERGIYFAGTVDPRYETVFSMKDLNEAPATGSLIIGKYGRGNFVYTGIVFFRELPAGVPGAYRLFANLLSLPKN